TTPRRGRRRRSAAAPARRWLGPGATNLGSDGNRAPHSLPRSLIWNLILQDYFREAGCTAPVKRREQGVLMSYFAQPEDVYRYLGGVFHIANDHPEVGPSLRAARLVLRLEYS